MLSPGVQTEVAGLLAAHPAASTWRHRARDAETAELFAEAAVWPDELRSSASNVGQPAETDVHRDWHYLNWPLEVPRSEAEGGQLAQQLAALPQQLADRSLPASTRSVALAWLLHLVGDAHTPLHAATWRGDNGDWSLGGNRFPVVDPFNPRLVDTNLHRYWDDLPGPPWLRGGRLIQRAKSLQSRYPASSITQADPERWLAESHEWVRIAVLPPGRTALTIDQVYREQATALADRRIAEAGTRLGRLLELLLRP